MFTYFFSFVTLYFMHRETFKVIGVRQQYLGTQSTITDRTFRLSGIPRELRAEDKIKELSPALLMSYSGEPGASDRVCKSCGLTVFR